MSESNNGRVDVQQTTDLGLVVNLPVDRIRAWVEQPRKHFNTEALRTLGISLKKRQRLPITVKKITNDPKHDYELIDGERRWRAAKSVGLTHLLAWVRVVEGKDAQFVDAVVSNLCRADHTPLEKAEALNRLHKMGMSRQDMADECGYSLGWIDQHLSLLRLEPEVQALMDPQRPKEKQLPFTLALRLVALQPELQKQVAEQIMNKNMSTHEARLVISNRTHEAGGGVGTKRRPDRDYRILKGFATRLERESGSFLTAPSFALVGMLRTRTNHEVENLVGKIKSARKHLEELEKKIETARSVVNP